MQSSVRGRSYAEFNRELNIFSMYKAHFTTFARISYVQCIKIECCQLKVNSRLTWFKAGYRRHKNGKLL